MSNQTYEPTLHGLLDQFEDIGGPEIYGPTGVSLLLALWRKSSKLGWKESFSMTNTEIHVQTGIKSRETINTIRNRLELDGLILSYKAPPKGQSRGDYTLNFHFGQQREPVQNLDNSLNNTMKVVQLMDNSPDSFAKPVQNLDNSLDTVLRSFSSSSSSSEINEIQFKKMIKDIENHFVQKRSLGLGLSLEDEQAIREIITDGMPVEFVNNVVNICFQKYKKKHRHDRIRTFTYCVPSIYDAWVKEQSITEPLEPVALGSPITENVPSEPVALGTTRKNKRQNAFDMLDQIAKEGN